MGNTVSAADISHTSQTSGASPPPECPMHQKKPVEAPKISECPVQHKQDDINPYNMVHIIFYYMQCLV